MGIMRLQDKLDRMRNEFESRAPAEALTVMHRATQELVLSGILEGVLKPGDTAPVFTLPDHEGQLIRSSELLNKGPLVIGFYRGVW